MSLSDEYFFGIAGLAALLAVLAATASNGAVRKHALNLNMLLMTVFCACYVFVSFSQDKLGKTNGIVAADQAEMQLRLLSIIHGGLAQFNQWAGLPEPTKKDLAGESKNRDESLQRAAQALELAIKQNPASYRSRAKLAVILAIQDEQANKDKIERLCKQMQSDQIAAQWRPQASKLGAVLSEVLSGRPIFPRSVDVYASVIKDGFGEGWYTNATLARLYKAAGATDLLKAQESAVHGKDAATCLKIFGAAIVILLCALIGIITIMWQAAMASRRAPVDSTDFDAVGLVEEHRPAGQQASAETVAVKPLPLKTIYLVFISWFSLQIAVSLCFHAFLKHHASIAAQPLAVAGSTAITYLCANIGGPLLIYYLALKPAGLDFWSSLKFRWRFRGASPAKLVGAGFLGVCSTIPLIFLCVLASHAQGSDNPVLGQIMQASTASSLPAILTFYFTLGIMAPFFEEILFRGFIFAALKPHCGTKAALIASSVLFAVMHFDRGGILLLTIIGLVLGYLFERTRSIFPSMIAHGLWNSGSFTLALLIFSA